MSMQRLAFPALVTTVLTFAPAVAAPLDLSPSAQRNTVFRAAIPSETAPVVVVPPAPVRLAAATGSNLGGGFIQMLFGGLGDGNASPPAYQYQPSGSPEAEPVAPPDRDWRYESDDNGPGFRAQRAALHPSGDLDPRFQRQEVSYTGTEKSGTIIINTRERLLYLVEEHGRALRYGIGVGRPGFTWSGIHHVSAKREWPGWTPPAQMLKRQPNLPRYMPGGPGNPLGARAMYLGSTLYRIHGSNEPWTIGHAVSSGCIRLRNEDVIDLYNRVKVGTKVVVI
jgi:lipoprotein-anchoring transpeptidase ErfK/SrfK